jgi:hypothetical protein
MQTRVGKRYIIGIPKRPAAISMTVPIDDIK